MTAMTPGMLYDLKLIDRMARIIDPEAWAWLDKSTEGCSEVRGCMASSEADTARYILVYHSQYPEGTQIRNSRIKATDILTEIRK